MILKAFFLRLLAILCTTSVMYGQDPVPIDNTWEEELKSLYYDSPSQAHALIDSLQQKDFSKSDSTNWYSLMFYKGLALRYLGSYAESLQRQNKNYLYYSKTNDSLMLANVADQLGIMNNFMGNMSEAQKYLLEAHQLYQKHGSDIDIAGSNNGLAIFYSDMNQQEKAIERYNLALKQYEAINDTLGRANVHANLGMLLINQGKYQEAEYHIGMQGKLDSILDTQWGLGFYYDFLGLLRKKQGRYTEALSAFEQSLDIRQDLESAYNIAESRASLASIYNLMGFYDRAIEQANMIVETEEKHQSLSQMTSAFKYLSQAHEGKNNNVLALQFHKDYKIYSDSIYNRDMLEEITQKDALFQRAEQDHEISLLNQEKLAADQLIKQKNRTIILGAVGLGLISLLSFFLGRLYRKVRLQSIKLEKALSEKDILLREIHHRVKNNLQLVSSLLNLQSRSIDDKIALEAINDGKSRVRSMALIHQDLYNRENLTGIKVKDYLKNLSDELSASFSNDQYDVHVNIDVEDMELDVDTLVPLGLIINELLTNSFKYAFEEGNSGKIQISLFEKNKLLNLIVKDNGKGYNPTKIRENSFGQKLVSTLSRQLDGELNINSFEGTTIELIIKKYKRLV